MGVSLELAIAAIRSGRKEEGRQLLNLLIQQDPNNDKAWLWMSSVVDTDEQRARCLGLRPGDAEEKHQRGEQPSEHFLQREVLYAGEAGQPADQAVEQCDQRDERDQHRADVDGESHAVRGTDGGGENHVLVLALAELQMRIVFRRRLLLLVRHDHLRHGVYDYDRGVSPALVVDLENDGRAERVPGHRHQHQLAARQQLHVHAAKAGHDEPAGCDGAVAMVPADGGVSRRDIVCTALPALRHQGSTDTACA